MIDLDEDLDLARETAKRPPDKWRPWYKAKRAFAGACLVCGYRTNLIESGALFGGHCRTFPSKDVSDTHGIEQANEVNRVFGFCYYSFECSLPDGETP